MTHHYNGCVVDGRLNVNVALNRPSFLSSTYTDMYGTFRASKGNDGDNYNCSGWSMINSLAHTLFELNPWFGVDLGVALAVMGVNFTNREDNSGKRSVVDRGMGGPGGRPTHRKLVVATTPSSLPPPWGRAEIQVLNFCLVFRMQLNKKTFSSRGSSTPWILQLLAAPHADSRIGSRSALAMVRPLWQILNQPPCDLAHV